MRKVIVDKIVFPYCKDVVWTIVNNKVTASLNLDNWNRLFKDRNKAYILCTGGLIENYLSISFLECLNYLNPNIKLYWAGDSRFVNLFKIFGLGSYYECSIDFLYACPAIKDLDDGVFINSTFRQQDLFLKKNRVKKTIFKIVTNNILTKWDRSYFPKVRNINSNNIEKWASTRNFNLNKPFVLIIPGKLGISSFKKTFLPWNVHQTKAFIKMLEDRGYGAIVLNTPETRAFFPNFPDFNYNDFFYLGEKCHSLFSAEIDFSLIALFAFKCKVFSLKKGYKEVSLYGNAIASKISKDRIYKLRDINEIIDIYI